MRTLQKKIKKATSTPVGKIIAIGILLVLLSAIAGGVIYWKIYRKQIIRNELENAISRKSQGLYSIRYDSLKLDEAAGNLAVANMKLEYDSMEYISLLGKKRRTSYAIENYDSIYHCKRGKNSPGLIEQGNCGEKTT